MHLEDDPCEQGVGVRQGGKKNLRVHHQGHCHRHWVTGSSASPSKKQAECLPQWSREGALFIHSGCGFSGALIFLHFLALRTSPRELAWFWWRTPVESYQTMAGTQVSIQLPGECPLQWRLKLEVVVVRHSRASAVSLRALVMPVTQFGLGYSPSSEVTEAGVESGPAC